MKKYEIYQVGKVPPLTVIEAAGLSFKYDDKGRIERLMFYDNSKIYKAIFNWNNIAGYRRVSDDD